MKNNYVGDRITSLRMAENISEYSLSRCIGRCNNYINKVTSGTIKPTLDTLSDICDYFGISLYQFFDQTQPELSLPALKITSLLPNLTDEQLETLLAVAESMNNAKSNEHEGQ